LFAVSEMYCVGVDCLIQFGGHSTSHAASNDCYVLSCTNWVWNKASICNILQLW